MPITAIYYEYIFQNSASMPISWLWTLLIDSIIFDLTRSIVRLLLVLKNITRRVTRVRNLDYSFSHRLSDGSFIPFSYILNVFLLEVEFLKHSEFF